MKDQAYLLKNVWWTVEDEESATRIQLKLFQLGYKWAGGGTTVSSTMHCVTAGMGLTDDSNIVFSPVTDAKTRIDPFDVFGVKPGYKEIIQRLLKGETIECLYEANSSSNIPAVMVYDDTKGCIIKFRDTYDLLSVPIYDEKVSFKRYIMLFGKAYDEAKLKELIKNNLKEISIG
jgi:hypothetical protein